MCKHISAGSLAKFHARHLGVSRSKLSERSWGLGSRGCHFPWQIDQMFKIDSSSGTI